MSRGRKPKKSAKSLKAARSAAATGREPSRTPPSPLERPESVMAVLQRAVGSKERPAWFDDAITQVLDGADVLVTANGPRELEQRTTELIGAQLYTAINDVRTGLRFDRWLTELADATRTRLEQRVGGDDWRPAFWLLHGLAAITRAGMAPQLPSRATIKSLRTDDPPPTWLFESTRVHATGHVWRMRDTYGTRYAVIARFAYPRGTDPHVLLLDIDTSSFIVLADVGVFDDVEQAATAWRATVGDSAGNTQPEPVTDPDRLLCLVHLDPTDEFGICGDEPRSVLDNWFRADRRIRELHDALRKRRTPLPRSTNLYRGVDITLMTEPFVEWYARSHSTEPGTEAVESLAEQWMEGALPETWFDVSPGRIGYQLALLGDWMPDEVTTEVHALLPEWVRWLGERAGLPAHLLDPVVAAARPATCTPSGTPV